MKKRKHVLLLVLAFLAVTWAAGRFYARYAALQFGQRLASAFSVLGRVGFADTASMREFFAQPEMAGYVRTTRRLAFLGGAYDARLDELQAVMVYYSEQVSLPEAERFAAPPKFKYFTIETQSPSDPGVAAAAARSIISFGSQL